MANIAEGPEALVGTQLGSCHIDKIIGSGGMGTVYLAHHGPSDTDVAVKVLAPYLASDEEYVARFIREGQEAKKIDHPNVVRVLDADNKDGTYYIVMEYVRGKGLDEILREEKRLGFTKATRFIRDVARGLEAAQSKGVIHRDIKPANILVDFKGTPKISDFGLAKQAGQSKGLTVEGLFMGTPEYVSPEQAEGKKVDFRTDIYSLGVTYYQLLTGKFPFMGQTDVEMAMKRLKEDPRPIQDAHPGVEPRAVPIVDKMLKRDPTERYQTATELLKALDPMVQGRAPASTVKTATVIKRLPHEVQRRVRVAFASMLLTPGLVLFFMAGAAAPGVPEGGGFFKAVGSLFAEKTSWELAGAGLIALMGALLILRRELRTSARGFPMILMLAASAVCAMVSLAALTRSAAGLSPWAAMVDTGERLVTTAIVNPANLMSMAVALGAIMCFLCFEKDEDSAQPVMERAGLILGTLLWYAGGASDGLVVPFKAMGGALEAGLPLIVLSIAASFFGLVMVSSRKAEVRTRKIGAGLLALGWLGLLILGTAGQDAATLRHAAGWPSALFGHLKTLPGLLPQSGALGIVAVLLMLDSVLTMRAGIARTQAFYTKKK